MQVHAEYEYDSKYYYFVLNYIQYDPETKSLGFISTNMIKKAEISSSSIKNSANICYGELSLLENDPRVILNRGFLEERDLLTKYGGGRNSEYKYVDAPLPQELLSIIFSDLDYLKTATNSVQSPQPLAYYSRKYVDYKVLYKLPEKQEYYEVWTIEENNKRIGLGIERLAAEDVCF